MIPVSWTSRPPASRRDLTDPVIDAERGKPDLLLRCFDLRKVDRKEDPREAGYEIAEKANA
jgi:hypothetical protein